MSKPLDQMTIKELKEFTVRAILRKDRQAIDRAKAETLVRAAARIADGTATDVLCEKVNRLTMKG